MSILVMDFPGGDRELLLPPLKWRPRRWECWNCGRLLMRLDLRQGEVEVVCRCGALNHREAGQPPAIPPIPN